MFPITVAKTAIKVALPEFASSALRRRRLHRIEAAHASLSLSDSFARIYADHLWGASKKAPFCSGSGSAPSVAEEYISYVRSFVTQNNIRRVVDIGCGDFQVGSRIVAGLDVDYVGLDIVPQLVEHNNHHYSRPGVSFICADATADELPRAGLCLMRQVLQHLSNSEISAILASTAHYPFRLVTEHILPLHGLVANLDKPHGPSTRLDHYSSVLIELPPFSVSSITHVLTTPLPNNTLLRTSLVTEPVR